MKKISKHIVFLITAGLFCGCIYASPAVDSLPACIIKMKEKDSLLLVNQYDYKGQRWFIMEKKPTQPVVNYPDKMTTTKFYNDNCQLVCTLTKGGIAGFNKVLPDTIDKTKIIKVADYKIPAKLPEADSLPSCILKMKQIDSRLTIYKYDYKGQQWFGIRTIPTEEEMKKVNFVTTFIFYNLDCKPVATWRIGGNGIKKINEFLPDSVDGTKIKKIPEKIPADNGSFACFLKMKQEDSLLMVNQYDYKGQRWFKMENKTTQPVENYPDKMTTTKFYNDNCQLVCTWTRGGIAGLNKVSPDTIDKTKILKFAEKVPEKIMQLAINHNAVSISKYEYLGQTLYFLNMKNNKKNEFSKTTIAEPYYDKNGKDIITFQRATSGMFLRAQRWEPYEVDTKELLKKGIIWYNPSPLPEIRMK